MPYNPTTKVYTRNFTFVDAKDPGDFVMRSDLDNALGDIAQALNDSFDLTDSVAAQIPDQDFAEVKQVGDDLITSVVLPGIFPTKKNYVVTINGVLQEDTAYTVVIGATTTTVTFSEPIPLGTLAHVRVAKRVVITGVEEGEITGLTSKAVADYAAALAWIAANAAPPVGFVLRWASFAVRYIGTGTAIPAMPGYVTVGNGFIEHYGGSAGASAATNFAAFTAGIAAESRLHFGAGFYNFGTNTLTWNASNKALIGDAMGRTYLQFTGSTTNALAIAPADLEAGTYVSNPGLRDLTILGPGVSHVSGIGLNIIMANGGRFENVSVQGFANAIKVAGGQLNRFLGCSGFARTGSIIADVTGTAILHIAPHIRATGSDYPNYTTVFEQSIFVGDASKNTEFCIKIGSGDGIQFDQGYIGFGRRANVYVAPEADSPAGNITATNLGQLYFDGVGEATGSLYGVEFGPTAFTGRVNMFKINSGAFIGNYQQSAIYARGNSLIGLFIDGANLSGCAGRVLDIEGTSGASGTRIQITGSQVRAGDLGGAYISGARVVQITGTQFNDNAGGEALNLSGTIDSLLLDGNTFTGNADDFANTATVTDTVIGFNNSGDAALVPSGRHFQSSATDGTAGRLLRVGAFGLGSNSRPTLTDLTAEILDGRYRVGPFVTGGPDTESYTAFVDVGRAAGTLTDFVYRRATSSFPRQWIGYRATATGAITWTEVESTFAVLTSIAGTPRFVGQRAVVGGLIYIATGTATAADWKLIPQQTSGTFTPVLNIGGVAITAGSTPTKTGEFSRNGNTVTFKLTLTISSKEAQTGGVTITGLPVAATAGNVAVAARWTAGTATLGLDPIVADILGSSTTVRLVRPTASGGTTTLLDTEISSTFNISVAGSYTV